MGKSCFQRRTREEIALICVVLLLGGVVITLVILLMQSKDAPKSSTMSQVATCDSQTCIKESLQILSRIDVDVDPCKDFYAFSCNNLPKAAQLSRKYGPFSKLAQEAKATIEYMFHEPVRGNDHDMVVGQKRLFQACLNETAVETDAFRTVQATLKAVGGWPVVEGPNWNESGFDWLDATYKLRQLGYRYGSFLDLNVVQDRRNEEKYIFEVEIPQVNDVYSQYFDSDERNGFMADVAVVFGAQMHHAIADMSETLDFLLDLQWKRSVIANDNKIYRATVEDIQQRHGTINWLEFINRIAGRTARITKQDIVLFPTEKDLDDWFNSLFKASKRLQANYMMWRVVEEILPYLTRKLSEKVKPRLVINTAENGETRTEYCINEVRKRFSPSPIDIMYLRKYLPKNKKDEVEELLANLHTELLEVVRQADWMSLEDKVIAEERIDDANVVIGAPGDYFDDRIFNVMSSNFNKSHSNNFLMLLTEANRNHKSRLYNLIHRSTRDTRLVWWEMTSLMPSYYPRINAMDVPATILQGEVFNEKRPHYLNYGIMGVVMKNFLLGSLEAGLESSKHWSNKTVQAFTKKLECITNETKINIPGDLLYQPLSHLLGLKVSHAAYQKWVEENGEELTLFGVEYTPKQLFWISSSYVLCHYRNVFREINLLNDTVKGAFANIDKRFINENGQLMRDFGCPGAPQLGQESECRIF